jgi:hypothetical protein
MIEPPDDYDQAAEQVHVIEPPADRVYDGNTLGPAYAIGPDRGARLEHRGHEELAGGKEISLVARNPERGSQPRRNGKRCRSRWGDRSAGVVILDDMP